MHNILEILALFFSVIAGGVFHSLLKKYISQQLTKLLLTFSGAFLFSVSLFHIIPEVYQAENIKLVGLAVFIGFIIQVFLEYLSKGIEHGHDHIHEEKGNLFMSTIFISLCIHAFLEGMPVLPNSNNEFHSHSLLIGIVLHKLPIAFVFASILSANKVREIKKWRFLIAFAMMSPLGAILGVNLIQYFVYYPELNNVILAVVLGIVLHVSTTIIFESSENHRLNFLKLVAIVSASILAFISL